MARFNLIPAATLLGFATMSGAAAGQEGATKPDIAIPGECRLSQPATVAGSLKDVPDVAAELKRQGIELADTGERFQLYDVTVRGLPTRQFVRAYVFSDRTILWYFHGGQAAHLHVVELRLVRNPTEAAPLLRLTGNTLTGPPCLATQAMLDGVRGVGPGEW
ncbi:MAG TPA: hypothetical protein VF409_03305 [Sphingomonas sp.]